MVILNHYVPKRQKEGLGKETGKHPEQKEQQAQRLGGLPWSGLCLISHPQLPSVSHAASLATPCVMSFHTLCYVFSSFLKHLLMILILWNLLILSLLNYCIMSKPHVFIDSNFVFIIF